jgi:hypothetical protein
VADLVCEVEATGVIVGNIRAGDVIAGVIQVGHLSSTEYLPYEGSYEVESLTREQILSTANKVMTQDIRIREISYQEVSNESGGYTVTIGGD